MNQSASGSVVLAGGGHGRTYIAVDRDRSRTAPATPWAGTYRARHACGLETTVVPAAGLELELIPPVPMPRRAGKDLVLLAPRLLQAVQATYDCCGGLRLT